MRKIRRFTALLLIMILLSLSAGCGEERSAVSVDDCAQALLENVSEPVYGSVSGDWVALGLARWGGNVPQQWYDTYYRAVEDYVVSSGGVLSDRKYTEYSRVILALTAIGKDPANVGGYNLLLPLADYEQTLFQGVNGPAYALLALDSGNYEIPVNVAGTTQATRQLYVDYLLSKEAPGGGWSLAGGEAEVDVTAMVLQALAKYRDRKDVADAVDRAVAFLSGQQNREGGYTSFGADSSESVAQVIVALTELGIPIDDARFVKKGNTLQDRLMEFATEEYGFQHLQDGEMNQIATEQAFYALVALYRAEQGMSSLYCMANAE